MTLAARISLLFVALLLGAQGGCGSGGESDVRTAWPTAGWTVESPEQHGMDSALLDGARQYAFEPGKHTQGVVVVRHGVIVAEWYEDGRDALSFATSWSIAKSVTSALIGIAIDEGLLSGVDQRLADVLPEWRGTDKDAITLRDVLQMSSGLEWDEDYAPDDLSDIIQMILIERDHLAYAASRPLAVEPGTRFSYSSGDSMLLSGVIEAVTGGTVEAYAQRKLFEPIGMAPVEWWRDASGHTVTYCCLDTPSRELARFGLLSLHGGAWDGTQVVPREWVRASISPSATYEGYGYQWWLNGRVNAALPADVYSAEGHNGQFIYVIPSRDLVVVRNSRYDKYPGPPMADPSLWLLLPSDGIVPGRGTIPPDDWDEAAFLAPILDSIVR